MDEDKQIHPYLPHYWNDDKQIKSLFAKFRNKDLNPIGWQSKMDLWIKLLHLFSRFEKKAVMNVNDIYSGFERNKKFPACIDEVLNYMHNQNCIKTVAEFIHDEECKTWLGWSYHLFIKYPLNSAWPLIRSVLFLPAISPKFIFVDVLKEMADKIFQKYEESKTSINVVSLEEFQRQCIGICDEESFMYALIQLQYENKLKVFTESGGIQAIKFQENTYDNIEFTDVDKSILKLKNALNKNLEKIIELEEEQDKCVSQARQHLREQSKDKALVMLKKKKRLDIEIQKKYSIQDNLESLFTQVQNCNSERITFDAFKASVCALKNCFNKNLSFSDVDNTMEEVREVINDSVEINQTLSESIGTENNDLSDLASELTEISKEKAKSPQLSEVKDYHQHKACGMDDDFATTFPEIPSDSIDGSPISISMGETVNVQEPETAV